MENWAMLVPALTSAIGAVSTSYDYSVRTDNIIKAMDLESTSYITQINIMSEQSIEEKLNALENAPIELLKSIMTRAIVVAGTGIGAWILYKFGISPEGIK